jgi:hypothetical protein
VDFCRPLTPLIRQFEAGKLRFKRSGPRGRDPNRWEIAEGAKTSLRPCACNTISE